MRRLGRFVLVRIACDRRSRSGLNHLVHALSFPPRLRSARFELNGELASILRVSESWQCGIIRRMIMVRIDTEGLGSQTNDHSINDGFFLGSSERFFPFALCGLAIIPLFERREGSLSQADRSFERRENGHILQTIGVSVVAP